MKDKLFYLIVNYTGDGKYLTSKQLQIHIFGEENQQHDLWVRKTFREIEEGDDSKKDQQYIFSSSNKGFQVAKTEEEIDHGISVMFGKADKIYARARNRAKAKERLLKKKYEPTLEL